MSVFHKFRYHWLLKKLSLFLLLSPFLASASSAVAMEFGLGVASIEEGDDRLRPGIALHAGFHPFYYARIFYYGRDFGPVKERTTLVALNRKLGLFRSNNFKAGLGIAVLSEHNVIQYSKEEDKQFDQDDNRFNVGFFTGFYWETTFARTFYFSAGWESGIFPAGVNGGLFLSTGRKQFVSAILGMNI